MGDLLGSPRVAPLSFSSRFILFLPSGLSITSNETDFTLSDSGVGYHFGTTGHSGTMVPVYLYGTGAERINGVMDNTELSKKIQSLMGLE